MRLLIIDDDKAHGESLADLLNTRGHEAYFASCLNEAQWLLDLFRFNLAIVDYDMPDYNGPQVAKRLQAIDPELRAIVMSARQNDATRLDELGSLPFVPKPISVDGLLELIIDVSHQQAGTALVVRVSFPLVPYRTSARPPDEGED